MPRETNYIPPPYYNNLYSTNHSGFNNYISPIPYDADLPYYTDGKLNHTGSDQPTNTKSESNNEKEPWSFTKICRRFAERTSVLGISYIHLSKTWFSKGAWTLIFLVGTGGMLFHLYYLFGIYLQFSKQTKVSLGFDTLPFPAVTICNVNPMRMSKSGLAGKALQDLLNSVKPTNVQKLYQKTPGGGHPNGHPNLPSNGTPKSPPLIRKKRFLDKLHLNGTTNELNAETDEGFGKDDWESIGVRDDADEVYRYFHSLFNLEPRNKRIQMGHRIDTMIIKCSFAGRTCHSENFTQFTDSYFGNCYTLQTPFFKSRRSGPAQGLEVILFLEKHEFIRGITNGNGVQVMVHDHDSMPHPYDEGMAVAPESETFIGLNMLRLSRMGEPYGICDDGTTFRKKYGSQYTRASCQHFCESKLIMDNCNCTDPGEEEVNLKIANGRKLPHECRSEKDTYCMRRVTRRYEFGALKCTCNDPCQECKYTKSVSVRQWPSDDYAELLLDILCNKRGQTVCDRFDQVDKRSLVQNFVKLNIYFESLNYQNITEEANYQESQFASDVGGTVGLWIGLSALTLMEIFQFIAEIIKYLFCGLKSASDERKLNERKKEESKMKGFRNGNLKQ